MGHHHTRPCPAQVLASSRCLSPPPAQPGLHASLVSFFFPFQVPDRPGVLDSGRPDHIQGVRDCFGRLASVTGEIVDPPWCCVSGVDASGWTCSARARRLLLGAVLPSWFWLPGVSDQGQAHEKATLGSDGQVCGGGRAQVEWDVPSLIPGKREGQIKNQ